MQKRVFEYIQEHQMIVAQDRVVVGVSGGADSVCLLQILLEMKKQIAFEIGVVHVNHRLRGAEADADQHFVEELCRKYQLECEVFSFAVDEIAQQQKLTVEEAGRMVRYEAFAQFSKTWGGNKVALAHHQNDVAETMLYNLARGSGVAGLCSIHPVREQYIRPLLCVDRVAVERYLQETQSCFRTDSSNLDDHYMRNRIRHHVIDYMTAEVNPHAVEHMADTAASLLEAEQYLNHQAELKMETYVEVSAQRLGISQDVTQEPTIMQTYILKKCYAKMAQSTKDLSRKHMEMMRELFDKAVGKGCDLPAEIRAYRTYQGVELMKMDQMQQQQIISPLPVVIPGITKNENIVVKCTISAEKPKVIPEKSYTKWLNYDKMGDNLIFRTRASGDFIVNDAAGGRKKIKNYFIDAKIPREERDAVLLLADGAEIIWIVGHRISEKYKVTKETEQVLIVQIEERENNE